MLVLMDVFGIKEAMSDFWRYVCMSIDNVVYWFVEVILQLIMDLSKVEIFTQTTINTFAKRIYIILGLVMVFKMMISFIQILIDPDTLTDKEKGAGSVLKRVVISLVLIVLVPSIFSTARKIQTYVLPIIPRVIMGVTAEDDGDGITTESKVGKLMAWYSFLPFFDYAGTCNDGSIKSYDDTDNTSSSNVEISSVSEAFANINRKDKSCGEGDYHYVYNHKIIVSTIVGAYLVFTLVTVAVQVAIRAIKFGICEFIAPIPIASYIDPKTSKQTFDKWVSTSIKVYLDLFIQLIVVYFVAFIFQTYFADGNNFKIIVENTGGSFWRATLVVLFMIIGLIKFVKEFPKFLSDLLGISTNGDISKIFKAAWASAAGVAGAAVGGTGNLINGIKDKNMGVGRTLASGAAGFASGLWRSQVAALKGKDAKAVYDSTTKRVFAARNQRMADKANGVNPINRMRVRALDYMGINDTTSLADPIQKGISKIRGDVANTKKAVFGRIEKTDDVGFYGMHTFGASSTIQSLGEVIEAHAQDILNSGNSELMNYARKFDYQVDKYGKKQWRIKAGEKFDMADLKAIQSDAQQAGISRIASSGIKTGAEKEIYVNTVAGHAVNSEGKQYDDFMNHYDISGALSQGRADIAKEFSNIGPFETTKDYVNQDGKLKSTVDNIEDFLYLFKHNQSMLDDSLSVRNSEVNSDVSSDVMPRARSSNQSWKNINKQ